MKSRTWMWMTAAYRFAALSSMLINTIAAPANAQGRAIIGTGSAAWTGGNRMSQPSQPQQQTWFAPIETNNDNVRYKVVPIGVLPGKTTSFLTVVRGVNNLEHVTGYSYVYTGNIFLTGQGFIWQNGKLKALPLLGGWPGAFAFGINDLDQVVGAANNMDGSGNILQTAVLWDHGRPVNLGALHSGWNSEASDVNIWGVVVGASGAPAGVSDENTPVVWYGGTVHALPLLPGEAGGVAEEINALGVIAGWQTSDTNVIPCLWYWNGNGYTAVNLGSLGGDFGQAFGINNLIQAVGYSLFSGNIHGPGFLWDYRHGLQPLPLLPPDTDATVFNINDLGQIVGDSQVYDNNGNFISQRAAIWENGTVIDLQTLVPPGTLPLTYEMGNINDFGDIAVNATNPDGSPAALLLMPIHH
jgi:probable HAF family extracellular repeat protein